MPAGAAYRFDPTDGAGTLDEDNLNSLDAGGNVYKTPGEDLKVDVSPLNYINNTGTPAYGAYAGATGQAVTGSATTKIYLDSSGVLQTTTGAFPSGVDHIRLATVVASASAITSITDERPHLQMG